MAARNLAVSQEVSPMFESLDEQIKHDLDAQTTKKQRVLLWLGVAVATVILFGGLYFGVRFIE
jgi:hypothetical protein